MQFTGQGFVVDLVVVGAVDIVESVDAETLADVEPVDVETLVDVESVGRVLEAVGFVAAHDPTTRRSHARVTPFQSSVKERQLGSIVTSMPGGRLKQGLPLQEHVETVTKLMNPIKPVMLASHSPA